ncbi:conserved hypothetical protein [Pseudomonas sp. 8Z]|uniref:DUF5610 domain-containing protein n=1 Tax=Pseudomonas sp. 8Z TaxID=2653166 RepID=UPI0012F37FB7|nr:DUF5610 domain-containing protein [Pseudomonas sp. 8Z]VXC40828.1 conserved hypothetical protein [Pseudomonas sp. 8Z]
MNLGSLNSSASRFAPFVQPQAARPASADAQNTLANRLADKLGMQPGALSGKQADYTPEKVADRMLGFIEQRLQSEAAAGADPAKLGQLLSQARDGVEKGFAEARKVLDGMGVLKGQVASDVDDTYKRIQSGLDDLGKRFAQGSTPTTSGSLGVAAYSERFSALAETFDMEVTTRDGDKLRISVAQASANWSQSSVAAASDGSSSVVSASSRSGSLQIGGWQVDVEGELDDDEVKALEKLFSQVQDVSDKFYTGDLSGAFDRAMSLNMDGEQLASMSLRLTQTSVRQATDAYGAVAGQGSSAVNGDLQSYAQGLLDALRSAGDLTENAGGMLKDLLKGGFSLDDRFDLPRLQKADALNSSLLDGLSSLLPELSDER